MPTRQMQRVAVVGAIALWTYAAQAGANVGAFPVEPPNERLHLPNPLPKHQVTIPILMYHRINVSRSFGTPAVSRPLTVRSRPTSPARWHG